MRSFIIDLHNQKFGKLTVIRWIGKKKWLCLCDCGKKTKVFGQHLKSGHTKSCGCYGIESNKQTKNVKHGFWNNKFSKGTMKFYLMWQNIKSRCNNPKHRSYKNYGGRGITYDLKWEDFDGFKKDMYLKYLYAHKQMKMKRVSIERKDVNGNYCKENCTFIEFTDQLKNTRSVRSFIAVSPNGEVFKGKNVKEFADKQGLNSSHIYFCLDKKAKQHKGWKFEELKEE